MKTLNDLREYAKAKEMNESDIERLIDELESDGNGYITDEVYNDIWKQLFITILGALKIYR